MKRDDGHGRVLVVVLLIQLVIAAVFIVLVATDSLPIPSGSVTRAWAERLPAS